MKFLVCIDGSEESLRAARKAALFAEKLEDVIVTLIHVYYLEAVLIPHADDYVNGKASQKIEGEKKQNGARILDGVVKLFEEKNIKAHTLLAKGHPAQTIIEAASKGSFDLVVTGSRGLGGLKKVMLGSVSNAVAQEVESTVMIVK